MPLVDLKPPVEVGQLKRLEACLRRQHAQAHGPTCECRAFEAEKLIAGADSLRSASFWPRSSR